MGFLGLGLMGYPMARHLLETGPEVALWSHICLALDSGKELNVPLPLTGLNQQMFQAGVAKGLGEADFCSGIKILEDLAGSMSNVAKNNLQISVAILNSIFYYWK